MKELPRATDQRAIGRASWRRLKHEAIEKALAAKSEWERPRGEWHGKKYGPYKVLVGKLTEVAQVPVKYELVKL